MSASLSPRAKKLVAAGNIDRAIKLCDASDYPILQLVKAGLTHANKGADEIDAALSEKLSELKPQVEKRVAALWSLANIATLFGLLGTILGLIHTFEALDRVSDPGQRQQALARGISEAMNCTAFGLIVAILGLIAFALLNGKTQALVDDINEATVQVLNLVTNNRSKINVAGAKDAG